jgi:hypothetical protein
LNTRKNNGRRRSFGRRKTDQSLKSHFQWNSWSASFKFLQAIAT